MVATTLLMLACGRTGLDAEADAGVDASVPAIVMNAAAPDAGFDAGTFDVPPLECPNVHDAGFVSGETPLGTVAFDYVWVGTERPSGHSCPHLSVYASNQPPTPGASSEFSVDFFSGYPVMILGDDDSVGTLTLNGASIQVPLRAHIIRADGLTNPEMSLETTRSTLTFEAVDAGFELHGAVDAFDCPGATWSCL